MSSKKHAHFVLVHGVCHGAWCWYKVKPVLEAAGHRVTSLDLSASGVNPKSIKAVDSFDEYSQPLFDFMSSLTEKVILVAHSFGGMSVATAADRFSDKVSAAVFVAAFLPDTKNLPSFYLQEVLENMPEENWFDGEREMNGLEVLITMGPIFLAKNLYNTSPPEDLELAKTVVRQGSLFVDSLSKAKKFSEETFGSVKKVYMVCGKDNIIPEKIQRLMIANQPVEKVVEFPDSDHMPMFGETKKLNKELLEVADKYA